MYISKTRFINWTRCPMYFPMELRHNPTGRDDIDAERERREERLGELKAEILLAEGGEEDEEFDATPGPELEALLPYYNQVEEEALKVARRYFHGSFAADSRDVHGQKLFEYELHGHIYRCYVDIYNENEEEINIIEVKATTSSKYSFRVDAKGTKQGLFFSDVPERKRGGTSYPLFVKSGNVWRFNSADSTVNPDAEESFRKKKATLLDRYSEVGKYPHDIAFQKFVIERALRKAGDGRRVNYYLAVLNHEYVYDGSVDAGGRCVYNEVNGQELITFLDMNETAEAYQKTILREIAMLESFIATPHDTAKKVPVGRWCAWGKNTECVFCSHCFKRLRSVPDTNRSNSYIGFRGFKTGDIKDKYQLINEGYYQFDDVPEGWLTNANHIIQRDCYDNGAEWTDREKMRFWLKSLDYPVYHFDFETFPCPLPRFRGETPYRQSVFEFSLHIEREPGVCDKQGDNFIFLNAECRDDEREALARAIVEHFEFNGDGSLHGTMLAQNTSFERQRLEELADLFPEYRERLLAIRDKSADLIDLLKTREEFYKDAFGKDRAKTVNYYHSSLSGSYSIKKTLPVLVPSLTYKGMDVGNGVQAYIAYLNYDSPKPTFGIMRTKAERRAALERYCQQDTWAMVEILKAVRTKV